MRLLIALALIATACGQTLQEKRWDSATLSPVKSFEAGRIVNRISSDAPRYKAVSVESRVPWYVIAGLHNMEASGSFNKHLHEGSPLSGRTRWVPIGRPKGGKPPFTWEYSAADALLYDKMGDVKWSFLDANLYACERYNGTGYLRFHPETPTPYLWAGTTVERPGKYVADGKWSSTARSGQIGIAALWKVMESRGLVQISSLQRTR